MYIIVSLVDFFLSCVWDRMEPITDHMRNVSLNHRAAEAAMSAANTDDTAAAHAGERSDRPPTDASVAPSVASTAVAGAVRGVSATEDKVSEPRC